MFQKKNECFIEAHRFKSLVSVKPGFHLQQTPRPRHKKQSDYVLEQSSFPLMFCFDSKLVVVVVEIGFMEIRL